jgi:hypothetical protein
MSLMRVILSLFVPTAHAVTIDTAGTALGPGVATMWAMICSTLPFCSVGTGAPALLALKVTSLLLRLIGGVAVGVIIYAGIRLIIARGGEEGRTEAKKIVMYAVLGLILALVADALITYAILVITAAAS